MGFVFGKLSGKQIAKKEDMDGNILIVGNSGSGKSSCIAIPSLLAWRERVFCIDIKGELYNATRHKRTNIKVFDPLIANTYGYDPFYMLRRTNNQAQEVEAISQALIPLPPDTKEPFWIESARNLLTGLLLHFYNIGYSFIDSIRQIQLTPIGKLVDEISDKSKTEDSRLYINTFAYMGNKELSGVYAELSRNIMIFATDKDVKRCFAQTNKIYPDDLERGDDIYICVPEHLLRQWKNLLNLMVSQFIRHFERRSDRISTPILFLLDEFARLGKIEGITDAFATLRSKKITVCIIIQSLAQLDLIYEEPARRVIIDNCAYKAVLGATDADSQSYFSRLVGTYEKQKISTDKKYEPITGFPAGSGRSYGTEETKIIKPEEFATLDDIILFAPFGCVRAEKAWYFNYL